MLLTVAGFYSLWTQGLSLEMYILTKGQYLRHFVRQLIDGFFGNVNKSASVLANDKITSIPDMYNACVTVFVGT